MKIDLAVVARKAKFWLQRASDLAVVALQAKLSLQRATVVAALCDCHSRQLQPGRHEACGLRHRPTHSALLLLTLLEVLVLQCCRRLGLSCADIRAAARGRGLLVLVCHIDSARGRGLHVLVCHIDSALCAQLLLIWSALHYKLCCCC